MIAPQAIVYHYYEFNRNKKKLQKEIDIKITNRGKEVFIEGTGEKEYYAEKVLDALNFGFRFNVAIKLADENFIV